MLSTPPTASRLRVSVLSKDPTGCQAHGSITTQDERIKPNYLEIRHDGLLFVLHLPLWCPLNVRTILLQKEDKSRSVKLYWNPKVTMRSNATCNCEVNSPSRQGHGASSTPSLSKHIPSSPLGLLDLALFGSQRTRGLA